MLTSSNSKVAMAQRFAMPIPCNVGGSGGGKGKGAASYDGPSMSGPLIWLNYEARASSSNFLV